MITMRYLKLPQRGKKGKRPDLPPVDITEYEREEDDHLSRLNEQAIGLDGMKIDRMFFEKFQDTMKENDFVRENVMAENWDKVLDYLNREIMNKPEEYFTPEKLRKSLKQDRKVTLREMLEYIFGLIPESNPKMNYWKMSFTSSYPTINRTIPMTSLPLNISLRLILPTIQYERSLMRRSLQNYR